LTIFQIYIPQGKFKFVQLYIKEGLPKVNPSTPQHKCWGLPLARAQTEGSGLTLSGALFTTLKGGAWRRRMGQLKTSYPNRSTNPSEDSGLGMVELQFSPSTWNHDQVLLAKLK